MSVVERPELDERTRKHLLAIGQYLRSHEFLETLCALEAETGVTYEDGSLPQASILEGCLDMFDSRQEASEALPAQDQLLACSPGVCCTAPMLSDDDDSEGLLLGANVTAVCWAAAREDDMVAVVATADRRLRAVEAETGAVRCDFAGLPSPPLSVDASREAESVLVLVTMMGGEAWLLRLQAAEDADGGAQIFAVVQQFKDHTKHSTAGRFAPASAEVTESRHFLTISRDRQALLYARKPNGEFVQARAVSFSSEVTSCCWIGVGSFALAVRDDHRLHYWDVTGEADGLPYERCTVNLNALGDSVVSFAVLALAASPDGEFIAVCTDKSRVIVLPVFSSTQVRNLYGSTVDEYDVPSVRFSLDGTFLYASSSLPLIQKAATERDVSAICGEVVVFQLCTGDLVLRLPCHTKPVRCLDRHPFKEALITGSFDRSVRFWN